MFKVNILGLGGSSVPGSQFGKPDVVVHLTSVNCQGSENQLTDCDLYPVDLEDGKALGAHVAFAGVTCTWPQTDPPTTQTDTVSQYLYTYTHVCTAHKFNDQPKTHIF